MEADVRDQPNCPTREEFCRVYYDRSLDYWDIADTWGVARWQVDAWRMGLGLPSRRRYGTFRRPGDPEWRMPSQVSARRRARVTRGLPVVGAPRADGDELVWLLR
jgi:hypothetical protein